MSICTCTKPDTPFLAWQNLPAFLRHPAHSGRSWCGHRRVFTVFSMTLICKSQAEVHCFSCPVLLQNIFLPSPENEFSKTNLKLQITDARIALYSLIEKIPTRISFFGRSCLLSKKISTFQPNTDWICYLQEQKFGSNKLFEADGPNWSHGWNSQHLSICYLQSNVYQKLFSEFD